MSGSASAGTLYIVSTPIGNLEDISIRAVRTLSEADLIAAEDTRTTGVLLRHYGIRAPLVSYHSYNEKRRSRELIEKLRLGLRVGLVSDSGTPGISDPAYLVVSEALAEGIRVVPVPGASAILAALVCSGAGTSRFSFEGFLPAKKGRATRLKELASRTETIVLYESPHRIARTLRDLQQSLGDRQIALSREITKKFEEHLRGPLSGLSAHFTSHAPRGEFVITIPPATLPPPPESPSA